jgi:hypothetical protein
VRPASLLAFGRRQDIAGEHQRFSKLMRQITRNFDAVAVARDLFEAGDQVLQFRWTEHGIGQLRNRGLKARTHAGAPVVSNYKSVSLSRRCRPAAMNGNMLVIVSVYLYKRVELFEAFSVVAILSDVGCSDRRFS